MGIVHLLLNPAVTTKRRRRADDAIRHALDAAGHDIVELSPSAPREMAATLVQSFHDARHRDVTRLIIAGGDGMVHHALTAIVGCDVVVGVVPVGTGNDFARALGLPTDIEAAVEAALGEPTSIDVISTEDGRLAASVVTGGFSGRVNARANDLRFAPGQVRYVAATALELAQLAPVELQLRVDDAHHDLESSLFAVANSRYFGGGMAICPDADPTDGLLDVTVVGPVSRFELAKVLPRVFSGGHVDHPAVSVFRGAEVAITTPATLWADGEPFVDGADSADELADELDSDQVGRSTTILRAKPGALRVAGTLIGS